MKKIKKLLFCNRLFGWYKVSEKHPHLHQRVRIWGHQKPARFMFFVDKLHNLKHSDHHNKYDHYCFEFDDHTLIYAKGHYWKKL